MAGAEVELVPLMAREYRLRTALRATRNYDTVLVVLAGFTMAPYAPWSSDRSIRGLSPRRFTPRIRRSGS